MKTNYTICLDREKVETLKLWLEKRGLSFSGYINSMIDEQIEAIEMVSSIGGKNVTSSTLLKLAGKMATKLAKESKK